MSGSALTPTEIAARWGCDSEAVLALIKRGGLPAFTLSPPGSKRPRWRVTLSAVEAFESGTVQAADEKKPAARRRDRVKVRQFF